VEDELTAQLDQAVRPLEAMAEEMLIAGHHHSLAVGVRKQWRWVWIEQGIYVADWWTEFFETVRRRPVFGRQWSNVRSVEEVAGNARDMLLKMTEWRETGRPPS
jgi:hypothetical protein